MNLFFFDGIKAKVPSFYTCTVSRPMLFYGLSCVLMLFLIGGCSTVRWNDMNTSKELQKAPAEIVSIFNKYPDQVMRVDALSPGLEYVNDIGELDVYYGRDSSNFRFRTVEMELSDYMPKDKVIADITFSDDAGNEVVIEGMDLLRLIPKIEGSGGLIYTEMLLSEYNRFGYSFRREHREFEINMADDAPQEAKDAAKRVFRSSVTNGCLEATKWEFVLSTEDYSDFKQRVKADINLNQNKNLAHSWFRIDHELYAALMKYKNPGKDVDIELTYFELSDRAESTKVDFEEIRGDIKYRANSKVLEIGHKSERPILPLDPENHYKKNHTLLIANKEHTYASILNEPFGVFQFEGEGFYSGKNPKVFDLNWMQYMDDVRMDVLDVKGTETIVALTLTGEWTPYEVNIGNVDLALISEQKLRGMLFGINTYPKSRRYNPVPNTFAYDADLLPEDLKPYVLLTDKKSGKFVNNQYKGIEKIYLSYSSKEKNVLDIYVLCYERVSPVWMASVKLPKNLREKVRIKSALYN